DYSFGNLFPHSGCARGVSGSQVPMLEDAAPAMHRHLHGRLVVGNRRSQIEGCDAGRQIIEPDAQIPVRGFEDLVREFARNVLRHRADALPTHGASNARWYCCTMSASLLPAACCGAGSASLTAFQSATA